MKNCVNCGAELDDNAKFRGECGTKQPEKVKKCSNCGAELHPGAKFCMECGTPVNASAPKQPQVKSTEDKNSDISVSQPDEDTISVVIKGIPFNLKLVVGNDETGDFYICETPVTQALWMTITGDNPSDKNENIQYPVTNITPTMVTAMLIKLQKETGVKFELPTKEQWEYAYRGGVKSKGFEHAGSDNLEEVAWIDYKLHPVGELFANELGLKDMDGNVKELLKGGEYTLYSSETDMDDAPAINGCRLVINLPVECSEAKTTSLQDILNQKLPQLKEKHQTIEQDNEERKKSKAEAAYGNLDAKTRKKIEKYKTEGGVIEYDEDEADEYKTIFPLVAGEEYQKHVAAEQKLLKKVRKLVASDELEWSQFCELYYDKDEKGWPDTTYDGELEYTIYNGDTLIVRGEGDLPYIPDFGHMMNMSGNFWRLNQEIKDVLSDITKIVILVDDITELSRCFAGFWSLETVIIPDTITEIEDEAFSGCNELKYITLPDGLRYIDNGVFKDTSLEAIFIPASVRSIDEDAFESSDLRLVFIPEDIELEDGAFNGCEKLNYE